MDKEIKPGIFEVENPVYMDYETMSEKYENKIVVVSNIKKDEKYFTLGGIVRYYGGRGSNISIGLRYVNKDSDGDAGIFNFLIPPPWDLGGLMIYDRS